MPPFRQGGRRRIPPADSILENVEFVRRRLCTLDRGVGILEDGSRSEVGTICAGRRVTIVPLLGVLVVLVSRAVSRSL